MKLNSLTDCAPIHTHSSIVRKWAAVKQATIMNEFDPMDSTP
jgi:hypothetical protein